MKSEENKNIAIEAIGLTKIFRDFWNRPKAKAVDDIDFKVYQGEVIAMLGPNGSGKSTTIKLMLGLLYPTMGSISVLGASPRDVKIKKRIGYLPEESYLYKHLTALETLDFYGALFNLSASERKKRSEQLLEMVGLSHARHRSVGEFSKGMARRIGLAQAMINDPDLLILDEPTSGLDPLGCQEVKNLIKTFKERGKTVVICSHLLSDVEDISDRVMILYGGKIRATGSLSELLTVTDETRIITPALNQNMTEKLLSILRENLKEEEFHIDNPTRTLEEFFLTVVDQAINDSVETSGVVSGGGIAKYLTNENETPKEIINKLSQKQTIKDKKSDEEVEKDIASTKKREKVKNDKLNNLLQDSKIPSPENSTNDEKSKKSKKLNEANDKLKHLLNDSVKK